LGFTKTKENLAGVLTERNKESLSRGQGFDTSWRKSWEMGKKELGNRLFGG